MEENYRKKLALVVNTDEYSIDDELGVVVGKSQNR